MWPCRWPRFCLLVKVYLDKVVIRNEEVFFVCTHCVDGISVPNASENILSNRLENLVLQNMSVYPAPA